jgi:hypothetical protein
VKSLARAEDRARVRLRLEALRPDSARRWGRMTAHQMACHVADNFRMALGERPVASRSGPLQRTLVKWYVLYAPLAWPHGIPTTAEVDAERQGTRPSDFAADRGEAVALLERLAVDATGLDGRAHPVFGPLSSADWLRWAYLHTDHHLRQFGL